MPDLLVPLYKLPPVADKLATLRVDGFIVRRAYPFDLSRTRRFITSHFSESWADEAEAAFARLPITCWIAIHEKRVIGFACVEATAKSFFGPTGVDTAYRGRGIGAALLLASLQGLREMGYAYGIIGAAGPVDFYVKSVNAIPIPDSSPGIYTELLGKDGEEPQARPAPVTMAPAPVAPTKDTAMKIALFGATGMIGQRILEEALRRGHDVTAISRDPSRLFPGTPHLRSVAGNIFDVDSIAEKVKGQDVVISAVGPGAEDTPAVVVDAAESLIAGLTKAGVSRLIVVGGAGSLEVAPGVPLVDTPAFPAAWKPIAEAHRDALNVYKERGSALEWTSFSPAAMIQPGERTGIFRLGDDQLLTDAEGNSRISAEDFAIALLDEAENPKHLRERFTVAY